MNYSVLLQEMLSATLVTLEIFFLTAVLALPLGMIVCMGRMSKFKVISVPIRFYLLIVRGTPLMLQLFFIFFGLKPIFHIAEIFRGGMESIPVGQYEAAKVLGFTKKQTFFKIVLPQVVKRIMPPMGNEFITLVKDTSLAHVISVVELMKITKDFANSATNFIPFIIAAVIYLILNAVVSKCFGTVEKKLSYYR